MTMRRAQKPALCDIRKMAAKKGGGQVAFQMDISCDEEWESLLEKKGLIVVDIYSGWCGPCVAMVSSLKKLKLEIGSDYLHFAIANADNVKTLERFRNVSEPIWMLIGGKILLHVVFGVNAPRLIRQIKNELENEMEIINGKITRNAVRRISELTEEEKERKANNLAKEREELLIIEKKNAKKAASLQRRSLSKLAELAKDFSCVIIMPQNADAEDSEPSSIMQNMMGLFHLIGVNAVDRKSYQIPDENAIDQIFFDCPIFGNMDRNSLKQLVNKSIYAVLLQSSPTDKSNEDADRIIRSDHSDAVTNLQNANEPIERRLCRIIFDTQQPLSYSELREKLLIHSITEEIWNEMKFPRLWTPTNYLTKASSLNVLFPSQMEILGYQPMQQTPPQIVMIYEAKKATQVNELITRYPNDVLNVGFFDSSDPECAKLLFAELENLQTLTDDQMKNIKMIISLAKENEENCILEFSQLIPIYISPDEIVGTDEAESFFKFPETN